MDKIPYDQLADMLVSAQNKLTVGSHWRHFRGTEYVVHNVVLIEATNEPAALYSSVDHPEVLFVRPVTSWLEQAELNGQEVPRFSRVV